MAFNSNDKLLLTSLLPSEASRARLRQLLSQDGDLLSLVFTSPAHLEQLYRNSEQGNAYWNYLRRPIDLMKKFNWASLSLGNLRRVHRLKKMTSGSKYVV